MQQNAANPSCRTASFHSHLEDIAGVFDVFADDRPKRAGSGFDDDATTID
jgi:hypothetical protein